MAATGADRHPKQPGMRLKNTARDNNDFDAIEDSVASDPGHRASGVQARAARTISVSPPAWQYAEQPPLISIGAPADPALLEPTYAYLSAYCFACFSPPLAQRLNVAIYELYANALRYGTGDGEVRIELAHVQGGVELRVRNSAEPSNIERLQRQVGRVREDASAAFSAEMNRFTGTNQAPPMLGIVRVAHEASLPLELRCEHQLVELSTRCEG
jgi:hypothetical protein